MVSQKRETVVLFICQMLNTLFPNSSEVMTVWHYKNSITTVYYYYFFIFLPLVSIPEGGLKIENFKNKILLLLLFTLGIYSRGYRYYYYYYLLTSSISSEELPKILYCAI